MNFERKIFIEKKKGSCIYLPQVGKFLRKDYEIRDLQGNVWKVFKEAYFIRKLKKC